MHERRRTRATQGQQQTLEPAFVFKWIQLVRFLTWSYGAESLEQIGDVIQTTRPSGSLLHGLPVCSACEQLPAIGSTQGIPHPNLGLEGGP